MELSNYLAACEPDYSAEIKLIGSVTHSPGYHTCLVDGTWSHQTRQSLDYALALLTSYEPGYNARGIEVVEKIVSLQDTDPTSNTYGIWSWYYEEPLAQMAPPDWNWADFCGARLLEIVKSCGAKLSDRLMRDVRAAIGHAGWSIFRRNVHTGYSNIAVMGGGVSLAAGELLGEQALIDYGRRKLQNVVAHHKLHGDFNEYNSPTYTIVVLEEAERFLHILRDESGRASLEALRQVAWRTISEHFHPPTQQWAGPHSRAYQDTLSANTAAFLSKRIGFRIGADAVGQPPMLSAFPVAHPIPCPPEYAARFKQLPEPVFSIRRRFILGGSDETATYGTTWFSGDVALGTVNRGGFWNQHRPLIAYFTTPDGGVAVLRARFLHHGRDFASASISTAQDASRALSVIGLQKGLGDFHPSLDRPAGGIFESSDFRFRFELTGKGVSVSQLSGSLFEMRSGDHKVIVHAGSGVFDGAPVSWEAGGGDGQVFVDAVCYSGAARAFDFETIADSAIVAGLELLEPSETPSESPLSNIDDGIATGSWAVSSCLEITTPVRPQ